MSKTMSLKQLAANRRNAQKSTRPRTPAGRAVSNMDATKHGILSKQVLVQGSNRKESRREFSALHQRFREQLRPVGPLEEMLVEKIVTAYWRQGRALTAEWGEIALSVDAGQWERQCNGARYNCFRWDMPEAPASAMMHSAFGNRVMENQLQAVRAAVEKDGELTETAIQTVVFRGKRLDGAQRRDDLVSRAEPNQHRCLSVLHWRLRRQRGAERHPCEPLQGIQVAPPTSGAKHIFSTLIGTPLRKGLDLDMIADISHLEDVRFNPDVWPASKLPSAPAAGGPHATWMRVNGTGIRLLRIDGETCIDTFINGYKVGIEANRSTNGPSGATFYSGSISNCGTALLATAMAGQSGLIFTKFDFDGDTGVNSQPVGDASYVQFHSCQITGRNGNAVILGGDWPSRMQFQNCTINGTLRQFSGTLYLVNSTLNSTGCHAMVFTDAKRAAFVGCNFNRPRSLYNVGSANRLLVDGRRATPSAMPEVNWQKVKQDYQSRQPARTNLYVVTDAPWGAKGDATTDDTTSIQNALNAAGAGGGGIVFLPGGKYKLLGTLSVPGGVELRGTYELRHRTWPGSDGKAKGAILLPYAGQTQTDGPPTVALEANSGVVGVTFSYEDQSAALLTPYPPTIQGRGGNVYVIGVVSPNSWYYADLNTFTCTNHFIYMADGFGLRKGFAVGNGSSGSIVDCHANWTYWIDNYDSQSRLSQANEPAVKDFIEHNNEAYILGDCSELLVKDFWIFTRYFTRFISQNGRGPFATCFAHMGDITIEGFRFEAAAPCEVNVINSTLAILGDYDDLTNTTVGVSSTAEFQGRARFFNTALFARPHWDFNLASGDIGFDLIHMFDHSILGARVEGGTLHLINKSSWLAYDQTFPVYQISFGAGAGTPGKISEIIGCSAANGVQYDNPNPANVVKAWANFPILTAPALPTYELASPQLLSSWDVAGKALTLSWPGDIGYFGLFQSPDVALPMAWITVTNPPVYLNNQWSVTFPANKSRAFFRLWAP